MNPISSPDLELVKGESSAEVGLALVVPNPTSSDPSSVSSCWGIGEGLGPRANAASSLGGPRLYCCLEGTGRSDGTAGLNGGGWKVVGWNTGVVKVVGVSSSASTTGLGGSGCPCGLALGTPALPLTASLLGELSGLGGLAPRGGNAPAADSLGGSGPSYWQLTKDNQHTSRRAV